MLDMYQLQSSYNHIHLYNFAKLIRRTSGRSVFSLVEENSSQGIIVKLCLCSSMQHCYFILHTLVYQYSILNIAILRLHLLYKAVLSDWCWGSGSVSTGSSSASSGSSGTRSSPGPVIDSSPSSPVTQITAQAQIIKHPR